MDAIMRGLSSMLATLEIFDPAGVQLYGGNADAGLGPEPGYIGLAQEGGINDGGNDGLGLGHGNNGSGWNVIGPGDLVSDGILDAFAISGFDFNVLAWLCGESVGLGPEPGNIGNLGHGNNGPSWNVIGPGDLVGGGILDMFGPEPGNIGLAIGDGIWEPFAAAAAAAIEWNGGIVDGENAGVGAGHGNIWPAAQEDEIGDEIVDNLADLGLGWNVIGVEAGAGNVGFGQDPEFARLGLYQLDWNIIPPEEEIEMDYQDIGDLEFDDQEDE